MPKVYCGAKDAKDKPKGTRFGTMTECAKKKQLRRYGRNKVDSTVLTVKAGKSIKEQIADKKAEFAKLTARIGRLKREYDRAKLPETRKAEIKQEHAKAVADRKAVKEKLAILVKKTK